MTQRDESRHLCPGCRRRSVSYRLLACPTCWPRLPQHIRLKVSRAWTAWRRNKTDIGLSMTHRDAVAEAVAWYDQHQHRLTEKDASA